MKGWTKGLAGILAAGVVLATGIGLGATAFASGSGTATGTPSAAAGPALDEDPGPLFGVVHGDLNLTRFDGSAVEYFYDRGVIVARDGNSLTVARMDGQQVTIEITPQTRVREGLRRGSIDDLVVGDRAMFLSEKGADGTFTAVGVRCISGPRHRAA